MLHQSSMLVASEASSVNKSSAVAENKVNAPNTVDVKANAQQQMITNNGIISGVTGTSTAEVPMMTMPLSVPLSGLTTIPLALCPMNGQGVANNVQTAGGIMPQPGLVLLNVGGNGAGLSKILTSPSQLQQPMQHMSATSDGTNQVQASQQIVLPQVQAQNNVASIPQVLAPVAQMPVQPSVLPQQAPAAYMLVPIHHLPTTQSMTQPQLPSTTSSTLQSQNGTIQNATLPTTPTVAPASLTQVLESSVNTISLSTTETSSDPTIPQSNVSYALPGSLSTPIVVPHPISASLNSNPIPTCTNPINDPHISSSVTGKESSSAPTSFATETTENEVKMLLNSSQAASQTVASESCNMKPITTLVTASMHFSQNSANYSVSSASPTQPPLTEEKPPKVSEKRKKGPAPKLDGDEKCTVCYDKASGYHYGVLSCEGCKGFFRRCIIKNSQYQCKEKGECRMDAFLRRKCQACRLKKCRMAGMKDENVFSEVHSGSKSKRKKKDVTGNISPNPLAPDPGGNRIPTLNSQQLNIVEMLQANENRYQWPSQEDVEKVTPWMEVGDSHRSRSQRFNHFTELTILIVQLVVEFTKQLPGFLDVSREDQIILLKACTIEVMLLRAAKQYDKKSKAINVLNGKYYDKSSFYRAGMQREFVDPIFDFCQSMAKLNLDEAEYALLVAINTFSTDRPNLKDFKKIEAVQDAYVELLRVYLKIHHPNDPLMFPRTLMKLVELRTLSNHHSEQMFALKVQDKQLPPLLAEIWDM